MSRKPKTKKAQLNLRFDAEFAKEVEVELDRLGRIKQFSIRCIFEHFLSLKPAERDAICDPRKFQKAA